VIFAGIVPGGQLTLTTEVENFPGFPEGIQGPDLMNNMFKQVERFGTQIIYDEVVAVDFSVKPFMVKTAKKEFFTKAVIIATGAEAKWLDLKNEQRLRGKGVSACATCDGFFFKGKEVVVIGGGDSAMEEANFLTKFASKVTIIHRRDQFKASKIMLKRAQENSKIEFIVNATVVDVLGDQSVSGVLIKDNVSGEQKEIVAQGYFAAIGHAPATKIFSEAGVVINDKGYIVPQTFTQTNIAGVFVAGDVHDHRYRQAITAAGAGCAAALDAEKYLAVLEAEQEPKAEHHWSTQQK
jgi:thioredoxin reductase (NADPH)